MDSRHDSTRTRVELRVGVTGLRKSQMRENGITARAEVEPYKKCDQLLQ
jgi:hypothetical protein